MADNVPVTAGSGTTVATDDVSGVHYPKHKLYDATADSINGLIVNSDGTARVDTRLSTTQIQVASSGLTIATTAYLADDQLGAIFQFSSAARVSGGSGIVRGAVLIDKSGVVGGVDVYLWNQTVTLASDNAANGVSDAQALFCQGIISLPASAVTANNKILSTSGVGVPFKCSGSANLFASLVTRSGHTFFGATNDLVLTLTIAQD